MSCVKCFPNLILNGKGRGGEGEGEEDMSCE